ncbi:hypothetical protein GQ55_5G293500 [Panicum hallii var. hallii]|uniref:Bacterial transcriptional activator domain-containing protein n=1 Tax=Panicum hallii var. hallii TaxID=1504633 RepID=A0A2T7DLC9_9POAL|nr:hypothetical protein GQ55_5G293500 [Panicum hallii var. hallii]
MAGRVLLRATALGLAAAGAGALHAISRWTPPRDLSPYVPSVRFMLLESAQGLQAALLGAHPLSGKHLRDVRARAEHDLALANVDLAEGGDSATAIDLRLLLAFLATRDGRADDALRIYEEAARDAPFDARLLPVPLGRARGRVGAVERGLPPPRPGHRRRKPGTGDGVLRDAGARPRAVGRGDGGLRLQDRPPRGQGRRHARGLRRSRPGASRCAAGQGAVSDREALSASSPRVSARQGAASHQEGGTGRGRR